jgi:fatty acid desaturase
MNDARTDTQAPGGRRIVALMILFTIAIAFDVVAIAGLAAVGGWWMLAMAFGVHVCASAIVLVEVADVIAGRTRRHRHARGR